VKFVQLICAPGWLNFEQHKFINSIKLCNMLTNLQEKSIETSSLSVAFLKVNMNLPKQHMFEEKNTFNLLLVETHFNYYWFDAFRIP
jgi:hypothetical protein